MAKETARTVAALFHEKRKTGRPFLHPVESSFLASDYQKTVREEMDIALEMCHKLRMPTVTLLHYTSPGILTDRVIFPCYAVMDTDKDSKALAEKMALKSLELVLVEYYRAWGMDFTSIPRSLPRQYLEFLGATTGTHHMEDMAHVSNFIRRETYPGVAHLLIEVGMCPGAKLKILRACDQRPGITTEQYGRDIDQKSFRAIDYQECNNQLSKSPSPEFTKMIKGMYKSIVEEAPKGIRPDFDTGMMCFAQSHLDGTGQENIVIQGCIGVNYNTDSITQACSTDAYRKSVMFSAQANKEHPLTLEQAHAMSTSEQITFIAQQLVWSIAQNKGKLDCMRGNNLLSVFNLFYFSGGSGIIIYDDKYVVKGIYDMAAIALDRRCNA